MKIYPRAESNFKGFTLLELLVVLVLIDLGRRVSLGRRLVMVIAVPDSSFFAWSVFMRRSSPDPRIIAVYGPARKATIYGHDMSGKERFSYYYFDVRPTQTCQRPRKPPILERRARGRTDLLTRLGHPVESPDCTRPLQSFT